MSAKAIFALCIWAATLVANSDARSLLHVISDVMTQDNSSASPSGSLPSNSRDKRSLSHSSAAGLCPVVPGTFVYLDNHPTFFDFHWNESVVNPSANHSHQCPASVFDHTWTNATQDSLRASCPWVWTTTTMFDQDSQVEVYPKFLKEARCLCQRCVNAMDMRCKSLRRERVVYKKIGCDNGHPVFQKETYAVKVGCYCSQ